MKTSEKVDEIAAEIKRISEAMRRFRDGPLNDRCIVVLLHDATKIPKQQIKKVLNGLSGLEDVYLSASSREDWPVVTKGEHEACTCQHS